MMDHAGVKEEILRACDELERFLRGETTVDEFLAAYNDVYASAALDGHEGGMELLDQLPFSTDVLSRVQDELGRLMPDGADVAEYTKVGRTEKRALRDAIRRRLADAALEEVLREVRASRVDAASS